MKYIAILLILLLSTCILCKAEERDKESKSNDETQPSSEAIVDSTSYNEVTPNTSIYGIRYQPFKQEFTSLDIATDYDIMKRKKKRRRRKSGTIDESLIYFSAGTGVLILTPTILSAVDKDVKVGGALAADFILAGILAYAIIKETR